MTTRAVRQSFVEVLPNCKLAVWTYLPITPPKPDQPKLPTIVLLHANGFHARCWDGVVEKLDQRLDSATLVAFDLRGHGKSFKPPAEVPNFRYDACAQDVVTALHKLGLRDCVGVGHSLGGHVMVRCAASNKSLFSQGLVLVDPVIFPPAHYLNFTPNPSYYGFVARRKSTFSSPTEFKNRLSERHPFSLWDEKVLDAYATYGLEEKQGSFELCCSPHTELCFYTNAHTLDPYPLISTLQTSQVVVVRCPNSDIHPETGSTGQGRKNRDNNDSTEVVVDFSGSPTDPNLWKRFKQVARTRDVVCAAGVTHFVPMQVPHVVAECISEVVLDGQRASL